MNQSRAPVWVWQLRPIKRLHTKEKLQRRDRQRSAVQ
jgi:hypothetical protein